jgi:predicted dehydrogenase
MVQQDEFVGNVRKVVFHHGHEGPKEIGCEQVFLDWLTDPVLNGGGALVDFGCYGANLMTCINNGERAVSVTAVTRQFKPEIYQKVDDEATIIVSYPESQCIIQASWNWPFGRKDMEIYGDKGSIFALNRTDLKYRQKGMKQEELEKILTDGKGKYEDPFAYFADVIHKKVTMPEYGLYSLKNNIEVVRILDAARESAKTGKTVFLKY